MPKRKAELLIDDMATALAKVQTYIQGLDKVAFLHDEKTIDAVVRNLEIVGEAARRLPDDFKLKNSAIPWAQISGLRNRIVHDYFGLDLEIVWEIVTVSVPDFSIRLAALRKP